MYFASAVIDDNRARAAGEPPLLDHHQREYLEKIVGPNPTTPEQRAERRAAADGAELAKGEAASRLKAFLAIPANVDRLIALVEQAPMPEPAVAPWLRKP